MYEGYIEIRSLLRPPSSVCDSSSDVQMRDFITHKVTALHLDIATF
jgi:hypothetical protein